MRLSPVPVAVALVCGGLLLGPAARATTVQVQPGESIQAALDAAAPGSTVQVAAGEYAESLTLTKAVRLVGLPGAHLVPPATKPVNACTQDPGAHGGMPALCIVGELADPNVEHSPITRRVEEVHVRGFLVTGFSLGAADVYGADHVSILGLTANENPGGGIFVAEADDVRISNLTARRNGARAVNLHDGIRGFTLTHSRLTDNHGEAVLIGDSTGGKVTHNVLARNCSGILAVDFGFPGSTGLRRLWVAHNRIVANNAYCAGDEDGAPSLSGNGVVLIGARHAVVGHNRICGHHASAEADLSFGGLALLDAGPLTGGAAPRRNRITHNVISRNTPADITYDGSGSHNVIRKNRTQGGC